MPSVQDYLYPHKRKMVRHRSNLEIGYGSFGAAMVEKDVKDAASLHVEDEYVAAIVAEFNEKVKSNIKNWPPRVPVFYPRETIPECQHGFLGSPEKCLGVQGQWFTFLEDSMAGAHTFHSEKGLPLSIVHHKISPHGHIPIVYEGVKLASREFTKAFELVTMAIPSDNRACAHALSMYPAFPDDLGVDSILLVDNKHKGMVDLVLPAATTGMFLGPRFNDRGQHALAEHFAHVKNGDTELVEISRVMSLAASYADLPILPLQLGEWLRQQKEGPNEDEVWPTLGRLLAQTFKDEAKLLDCEEGDPNIPSFVVLTGFPAWKHDRAKEATRAKQQLVINLAKEELKKMGRTLPPGLSITWSGNIEIRMKAGKKFGRLWAIRMFATKERSARFYVNKLMGLSKKPLMLPPAFKDIEISR